MRILVPLLALVAFVVNDAGAALLWSTGSSYAVNDTDVTLSTGLTRSDSATDTLYFRYRVDPTSEWSTENYFAAFQLYQGGTERLGVGNAWENLAYSVFNTSVGRLDLNSATPESGQSWQVVRNTDLTTIVFKIQYNSSGNDNVTAWLNPTAGSEASQLSSLTTMFTANGTFDQIRLREGGGGGGWTYDNLAIATDFNDIVPVPEPINVAYAIFSGIALLTVGYRRLTAYKR